MAETSHVCPIWPSLWRATEKKGNSSFVISSLAGLIMLPFHSGGKAAWFMHYTRLESMMQYRLSYFGPCVCLHVRGEDPGVNPSVKHVCHVTGMSHVTSIIQQSCDWPSCDNWHPDVGPFLAREYLTSSRKVARFAPM